MRAVKDGSPAPSGEVEESEGPRSTAADKASHALAWLGIERVLLVRRAHSRIDQATCEKEVWEWEDARSWNHFSHS